jgi:hypothetical protein
MLTSDHRSKYEIRLGAYGKVGNLIKNNHLQRQSDSRLCYRRLALPDNFVLV